MRSVAFVLSTLFLAGCDAGLGRSQDASFIDPGGWEITNGQPGYEATYRRCFTKEEIAKPDLGVLNLDNPGCSKDRFSVSGGKISFASGCPVPEDKSTDGVRMRGDGQYDSKSFELTIHRSQDPEGRDAAIRGKWVGECQAGDQS